MGGFSSLLAPLSRLKFSTLEQILFILVISFPVHLPYHHSSFFSSPGSQTFPDHFPSGMILLFINTQNSGKFTIVSIPLNNTNCYGYKNLLQMTPSRTPSKHFFPYPQRLSKKVQLEVRIISRHSIYFHNEIFFSWLKQPIEIFSLKANIE